LAASGSTIWAGDFSGEVKVFDLRGVRGEVEAKVGGGRLPNLTLGVGVAAPIAGLAVAEDAHRLYR
jgi:hypothetical protein